MEEFKIEVIRTDEYKIEVDPNVWTKEELQNWSNTFWNVETTEDIAKALATSVTRQGTCKFYEGFGNVKTEQEDGYVLSQYKRDEKGELVTLTDDDYTNGLKIIIISEDYDYQANLIED